MHSKERTYKGTARKQPPASQGESPRKKPRLFEHGLPASRTVRKCISVVQVTQAVVFYYGSQVNEFRWHILIDRRSMLDHWF